MPVEASGDRLRRILVMVPWIMANPECTVSEVCERFALGPDDLAADMELLSMCGLPPFTPGDLIESFIEGETISIAMADYLAQPPRLTRAEAIAMLVMGRALSAMPGMAEAVSLRSALDKLNDAMAPDDAETVRALSEVVAVELGGVGVDLLPIVREAVERGVRITMTYWSAGRNEVGERNVDPLVVFGAEGRWYLAGRDDASDEVRTFRIDRIKELSLTDTPVVIPADFDPARYVEPALYTPGEEDIEAVIDVAPAGRWLIDNVQPDRVDEAPGDRLRVTLRTKHLDWLVALLLSAGADATAVRPASLVEQVREAASRALAAYA